MKPAMESVKQHGIENVLITMWGDNGKECSFYALLPSLFAVRCYADGIVDEKTIKEKFFTLFGVSFDDFMLLDIPNITPYSSEWKHIHTPSKVLLYSDCFMNANDGYEGNVCEIDYGIYAKRLGEAVSRVGEYGYIFETLATLCLVLEKKATLSNRTRNAYEKGDKEQLKLLLADYEDVIKRIDVFHAAFYCLWSKENKAFGWEIHDVRIGGLIRRVKTCKERIEAYIVGQITEIEELDTTALPLSELPFPVTAYNRLVSVSEL